MGDLDLLKWRESRVLSVEDDALAEAFAVRAADVRGQVCFLLGGGLTEGADEALAALAEQDMVDFCIMVDLAAGMAIPGVEPLDAQTALHLNEFLDEEPWHSLQIDNDITIALATVEDMILQSKDAPWYRIAPQFPVALANLMDRVNREQYLRFAGELEARLQRHPDHQSDGLVIVRQIMHSGAQRVGAPPPQFQV
jgi:hypothetical protein